MLMFELDSSHYQTCSILAQCADNVATVHLAHHIPSGTLVALKKFHMEKSKEEFNLIQNEIILTRQLQHPNLLTYHAAFVSGPEVFAVSPLMSFGSCRDLLSNNFPDGLPEAVIAFILRDVLQGLDYIHRKGYIHRGIRASHILVSSCGRACLCGLKYACPIIRNGRWQRSIHSFPQSTARNLNWLSPELLEQNLHGYNEKSDIYSMGMTSCELANGLVPFADMSTTLMLTEKVRGVAPPLLDCSTVPACEDVEPSSEYQQIHTHHTDSGVGDSVASSSNVQFKTFAQRRFSEPFHQLTELCIQKDPDLRPSANQMLNHSFFKQCRRGGMSLPELLHQVTPITERRVNSQVTDDGETMSVTDKMAELDTGTHNWEF